MATPIISIFDVPDYDGEVRRAARMLSDGKLVVVPTETVYGVAALLSRSHAIAKLRTLRADGQGKPLTVHLARREDARQFLGEVGELGERAMKKLWPGPVGLLFEVPEERRSQVARAFNVDQSVLYENGTITLRCPEHVVFSDVVGQAGGPVVAVKAGLTAGQSALRVDEFAESLDGNVDLILDAGPTRYSKPSTIIKVGREGYEIVRSGVYDQRIIERLLRTTILFVCSGNTCRSPMAEALTRHLIAERLSVSESDLEKKGITVVSAGSFAMPGARATPQAVDAVRELGADLSRHRSRPLTVELIHQADVIFTMGRSHAQAVAAMVPSAADKVATLDPEKEIDDPIGGDGALYRTLAGQMQTLIAKRLLEKVPL